MFLAVMIGAGGVMTSVSLEVRVSVDELALRLDGRFSRPHQRSRGGKDHNYWSVVESVRTNESLLK